MTPLRRVHDVSEGEKAAASARIELGLGLSAPVSILDAVEDLAATPVCIQAFNDEVAGLFYRRHGRTILFVNGTHPVARQRFTLAHEFGHLKMGHKPRIEFVSEMNKRNNQEVQANNFAGAFLAPREAVHNWIDRQGGDTVDLELVVRMAAFFGISSEASRIRLEVSGVVNPAESRRLKARIAGKQHHGMANAMGLAGFADSLSRLRRDVDVGDRGFPRLPAKLVRTATRAHEDNLLEDDDFKRLLRGTPVGVTPDEQAP